MKRKNKLGKLNDTSEGDAAISTTNTMTFIKFILIVVATTMLIIVPGIKLLNSKAIIPVDLEPDVFVARLTNVCFATPHEPFEILDQKIIHEDLFTEHFANQCFTNINNTGIKTISLGWKGETGKYEKKTLEFSKSHFTSLDLLYVYVETKDGSIYPGTLAVYK